MNALGQRTIQPSMASKALIEAIIERRPYSPLMFFYLGNAGRTNAAKRQSPRRAMPTVMNLTRKDSFND